ncbi:hypothetical protein EV694_1732 [Volucribacter psittacicida]|uniref:Uncharacterized protein n=1 Tax=Volucribacter psittacicida TaxID=203482 RepID=A0A4R1FPV8_9PAST|nr:hypothetical protein [Volucribacter psittacicida]TCJ96180.1 hypothetical protein EV694_1732 [Volucribacter psittacicida]
MSDAMLQKMKDKRERLEQELQQLCDSDPRLGHGGTPYINNAKGRRMKAVCDKHQNRIAAKIKEIEAQDEKIERMEWRLAERRTQTQKSQKFLNKNPIHQGLIKLAEKGLLNQWLRNPEYFFIKELKRVALMTVNNAIIISSRFPAKDDDEIAKANELIQLANNA